MKIKMSDAIIESENRVGDLSPLTLREKIESLLDTIEEFQNEIRICVKFIREELAVYNKSEV